MPEYHEMQAKELARLDRLERELWGYWERSQADATQVVEEEIGNVNKGAEGAGKHHVFEQDKRTVTTLGRDGDAKFVDSVMKIVAQRCKILGLNAPKKHQVDWRKQAEEAGISNASDIFEEMVEKFMLDDVQLEENESSYSSPAEGEGKAAVDGGHDGGSAGGSGEAEEISDS